MWRPLAPMARQRRLGPAVSHAGHGAGAARAWPHPGGHHRTPDGTAVAHPPHFLFNTLNSAIALVRAEPAKAESLLEDLSDLFRHALVEQGESVTLAEEITLAQRYLAIEEVRFATACRCSGAHPRTDAARLPPLLLQPLVENAVKHGVEPSRAAAS